LLLQQQYPEATEVRPLRLSLCSQFLLGLLNLQNLLHYLLFLNEESPDNALAHC
jgi:hypothetical protein